MPRWIPLLIGLILVGLAGLAVFTGLRYRANDEATLTQKVKPTPRRSMSSAPQGEPEAGASLVVRDNEGDDATPPANAPVQGESRTVITGGPGGVDTTTRIWARRGMLLRVTPAESLVYVNNLAIGHVRQFDTPDEIYDFAAAGSYTVKVVAPSGKQKTYIVTAAEDAKQDVATIQTSLD